MEKKKCHGNSAVTCPTETSSHKSRNSWKKGVREFSILNFQTPSICGPKILCKHSCGQGNEEDNYRLKKKNLKDRFPFPLVAFHRNCPKKCFKMRAPS